MSPGAVLYRCWLPAALALCVGAAALAQYQIPPQSLPTTEEPPLAGQSAKSAVPPTPIVSIVVAAPGSVKAGDPIAYQITVENRSRAQAHHVWVTNPIPKNASFVKANPEPTEKTESLLRWKIGTLEPESRQMIELTLQSSGDGEVANVARVQFEHGEQVVTRVRGPQLTLKKIAAAHAYENEAIPCKLLVENSGPVTMNNIRLTETVGDGLEHEGTERGSLPERSWDVGALKPGEKREVAYSVIAKKAGTLSSTAVATDGNVRSESKWTVVVGKALLDIALTGPDRQYVGQPAAFQATIKNTGSIPLSNVAVVYHLPKGVRIERATQDSEAFQDRVQWNIARIEPGTSRIVRFDAVSAQSGLVENKVSVLAKGTQNSAAVVTEFVGAVGLRLTIRESSEPIRRGDTITYTLRIQNTGSSNAENVLIKIDYSLVLMKFLRASVKNTPEKDGSRIVLEPITVRARDTVIVTVTMTATSAGRAVLHCEMTGADLHSNRPVIVEESTTITD